MFEMTYVWRIVIWRQIIWRAVSELSKKIDWTVPISRKWMSSKFPSIQVWISSSQHACYTTQKLYTDFKLSFPYRLAPVSPVATQKIGSSSSLRLWVICFEISCIIWVSENCFFSHLLNKGKCGYALSKSYSYTRKKNQCDINKCIVHFTCWPSRKPDVILRPHQM